MKTPTLIQHIGFALALTLLAALNDFIFGQFFPGFVADKLNSTLLVSLYMGILIRQSPLYVGRVTLFIVNLCFMLVFLLMIEQLNTLLMIFTAMIWGNRSLLYYSRGSAIVADFGLCIVSTGVMNWAFLSSNNLVMAWWCFLLLQAMFTLIPGKKVSMQAKHPGYSSDHFNRALVTAENALQQLLRKG